MCCLIVCYHRISWFRFPSLNIGAAGNQVCGGSPRSNVHGHIVHDDSRAGSNAPQAGHSDGQDSRTDLNGGGKLDSEYNGLLDVGVGRAQVLGAKDRAE